MKKNPLLFMGIAVMSTFGMSSYAQNLFLVQQPSNLAGSYTFTDSFTADGWGADLDTTAITAEGAWALDGTSADSIVCESVVNGVDVNGKIAFLYRGSCNFSLKAYNGLCNCEQRPWESDQYVGWRQCICREHPCHFHQ